MVEVVLEVLVEEVAVVLGGVLVMAVVDVVGVPVAGVMELIVVEVVWVPVGEVVVGVLVAEVVEVVSTDTVTVLLRLLVVTTNAHIVYAHHVLCQDLQVFLKVQQLLMVGMLIRDIRCTASSGKS